MTYSDPPPFEEPAPSVARCPGCGMAWTTVEEVALLPEHPEPVAEGCSCDLHTGPLERERLQHEALGRHSYRAWRRVDQERNMRRHRG